MPDEASIGPYHVIRQLGQGGMATVYLARDPRQGTEVAVKVIRMEKLPPELSEQFLRRFDLESHQMALLRHPNIVSVVDSGYANSAPYLAMDFVTGGTLKDRLGQAVDWREAIRLVLPIAHALQHAHDQGIIHRDVKPANILLRSDGTPLLSDFGIAKTVQSGETTLGATLTATGALVGTPEYMSPEQARGDSFDHRVDIYALGIVLFELIAGRRPFEADTPWEVLAQHISAPVPRLRHLQRGLPHELQAILDRTLAKKPDHRYATMEALAHDLETMLQVPTNPRRRFWPILFVAGILLVCGALSAWAAVAWTLGRTATPTTPPSSAPITPAPRPSFSAPAVTQGATQTRTPRQPHTPTRASTRTAPSTFTQTPTKALETVETVAVPTALQGRGALATPPSPTASPAALPPTVPATNAPPPTAIPAQPTQTLAPPVTDTPVPVPPTDTPPPPTRPPTPTA